MITQTWLFGKDFLDNEQAILSLEGKIVIVFVANDKA